MDMGHTIHEIRFVYCVSQLPGSIATLAAPIMAPFAFLTNHALALIAIAQDPRARMRDIAVELDITERAAQRIVGDLCEAGYVNRVREGRRNAYTIRTDVPVALSGPRKLQVGDLLKVLVNHAAA
jgi:hypothetical protein